LFLGLIEIQILPPVAAPAGDPGTGIFAIACESAIGWREGLRFEVSARLPLTEADIDNPHEKQMASFRPAWIGTPILEFDGITCGQGKALRRVTARQFYHNPILRFPRPL
jgi:hypothetical protein